MRRLVVLLVVLLVASTSPAVAATRGTPGRLVFESAGDLYVVNRDGTGFARLTTGGVSHNPRWSPDGSRIAFNRRGDLWVMGAAGSDARRVTTTGRNVQPDWSPDGRRLVFVHVPVGSGGDVWTVPLSGGAATRITRDGGSGCGDSRPTWSPRGTHLAYERSARQPSGVCVEDGVVVLRLRDRAVVGTTDTFAGRPDFTADGEAITYSGLAFFTRNLFWSSLDGSVGAQITDLTCSEGDRCFLEGSAGPTSDFPGKAHVVSVSSNTFLGGTGEDVHTNCVTTIAAGLVDFCTHLAPWTVPAPIHEVDWQGRT
jgi:Tol biopolymer transport system component